MDTSRDLASLYFGFEFNGNINTVEELKEAYEGVKYEDIKKVRDKIELKMTSILKEGNHE
jgi:hypothetical protein